MQSYCIFIYSITYSCAAFVIPDAEAPADSPSTLRRSVPLCIKPECDSAQSSNATSLPPPTPNGLASEMDSTEPLNYAEESPAVTCPVRTDELTTPVARDSLQIASVCKVTASSLTISTQCHAAPMSSSCIRIVAAAANDSCDSVGDTIASPPPTIVTSSLSPPSPLVTHSTVVSQAELDDRCAQEFTARTSQFNLTFGCLDDLLPEHDPDRLAYIRQKCTVLRYPLPLAAAMSKLYPPTKIPNNPARVLYNESYQKSVLKKRLPDHGVLEITSNHFTFNTGSSGSLVDSSPQPRTKDELRQVGGGKPNLRETTLEGVSPLAAFDRNLTTLDTLSDSTSAISHTVKHKRNSLRTFRDDTFNIKPRRYLRKTTWQRTRSLSSSSSLSDLRSVAVQKKRPPLQRRFHGKKEVRSGTHLAPSFVRCSSQSSSTTSTGITDASENTTVSTLPAAAESTLAAAAPLRCADRLRSSLSPAVADEDLSFDRQTMEDRSNTLRGILQGERYDRVESQSQSSDCFMGEPGAVSYQSKFDHQYAITNTLFVCPIVQMHNT